MIQNSTAKYFKYAIGEILLVMIGILLALQINNWNDGQKDRDLEQTFLKKLKSNLENDIALFKEVNIGNANFMGHLDSARIILQNHKEFNTEDLQKHLRFLMYSNRFNTNQTAFDNLVSIGKMNIIQNDSLTDNLLLYYRKVQLVKESIAEGIDAYNRNIFGPALLNFDYINPSDRIENKGLKHYIDNPIFMNSLETKMTMFKVLIRDYQKQMVEAENLITLINTELKND